MPTFTQRGIISKTLLVVFLAISLTGGLYFVKNRLNFSIENFGQKTNNEGYIIYQSLTHVLGITNLEGNKFEPLNKELDQIYSGYNWKSIVDSPLVSHDNKGVFFRVDGVYYDQFYVQRSSTEYYLISTDGKKFKRLNFEKNIKQRYGEKIFLKFLGWSENNNSVIATIQIIGQQSSQTPVYIKYDTDSEILTQLQNIDKLLEKSLQSSNGVIVTTWSPSRKYYAQSHLNDFTLKIFDSNGKLVQSKQISDESSYNGYNMLVTPPLGSFSPFNAVIFSSDDKFLLVSVYQNKYTKNPLVLWKSLNLATGELKTVKTINGQDFNNTDKPILWQTLDQQ